MTTPSNPAVSDASKGPGEDAKAKFRAALDRKKAGQHKGTEGGSSSGSVRDSDPVTASQRNFRRKSG